MAGKQTPPPEVPPPTRIADKESGAIEAAALKKQRELLAMSGRESTALSNDSALGGGLESGLG